METTIACCLECLKALALISTPIIPFSAAKVWHMLGYEQSLEYLGWKKIIANPISTGQQLKDPQILFCKIEDEQIDREIAVLKKMSDDQAKVQRPISYVPLKEAIDIDDVRKLDLRIGTVINAENIAKSKKLLKLEIDLGFEKRTIVSGISQSYTLEQIIGKKVVVVVNLKPAVLMGIQSQGMLLCGGWDNSLEAISIKDLPNGSVVS